MKPAVIALLAMLAGHHCPPDLQGQKAVGRPDYDIETGIDITALPDFCKREPKVVLCHGASGTMMTLAEVTTVWSAYVKVFQYRDDMDTHNVDDHYDDPVKCGDCEDFALTMSDLLAKDGQAGNFMALQFENICDIGGGCGGHATLWVQTTDWGWVELDQDSKPAKVQFNLWGRREGYVLMDGRVKVQVFPGFVYDGHGGINHIGKWH